MAEDDQTMKNYTVLLLYPDYIADEFGKETYLAWVEAESPEQAIAKAQTMAWVDNTEGEDDNLVHDDFHPLLVVEGHLSDLTPERWR